MSDAEYSINLHCDFYISCCGGGGGGGGGEPGLWSGEEDLEHCHVHCSRETSAE